MGIRVRNTLGISLSFADVCRKIERNAGTLLPGVCRDTNRVAAARVLALVDLRILTGGKLYVTSSRKADSARGIDSASANGNVLVARHKCDVLL